MTRTVFSILFCVLATFAMVIAVGMSEVRADDQAANQARADFRRDLAAAKACRGAPFEWEDSATLICHREVRP